MSKATCAIFTHRASAGYCWVQNRNRSRDVFPVLYVWLCYCRCSARKATVACPKRLAAIACSGLVVLIVAPPPASALRRFVFFHGIHPPIDTPIDTPIVRTLFSRAGRRCSRPSGGVSRGTSSGGRMPGWKSTAASPCR